MSNWNIGYVQKQDYWEVANKFWLQEAWDMHASTHYYIIVLFRKACKWVDILHIKGKQISQLDWRFTYGHIAQLIIVPRCSYLIQQNAKL
jgi:hypothetical protein